MSILIKGMAMPKNCWDCPMVSGYELSDDRKVLYSTVRCRLLNKKRNIGEAIDPNCPLIELPPHGRLIDADDIEHITVTHEYIPINDWWVFKSIDAPTIIESEG